MAQKPSHQYIVLQAILAVFIMVCSGFLTSCTFFELPPRSARDSGIKEKLDFDWLMTDKEHRKYFPNLYDLVSLKKALCPGLANVVRRGDDDDCPDAHKLYVNVQEYDPQKGVLASEFLHISDAQIRDESLYESSPLDLVQLGLADVIIDVTIRRALVERFDSLTLASFLLGYEKGHALNGNRPREHFIVHTGDLLDISVVSEVMEGLEIFKGVKKAFNDTPEIRSVAGNHDGLIFGNIDDGRADGRGLDINKTEFVFAHHLEDPSNGFGFGRNEMFKNLKKVYGKIQTSDPPLARKYKKECQREISPKVKFLKDQEDEFPRRWYRENIEQKRDENFFKSERDYRMQVRETIPETLLYENYWLGLISEDWLSQVMEDWWKPMHKKRIADEQKREVLRVIQAKIEGWWEQRSFDVKKKWPSTSWKDFWKIEEGKLNENDKLWWKNRPTYFHPQWKQRPTYLNGKNWWEKEDGWWPKAQDHCELSLKFIHRMKQLSSNPTSNIPLEYRKIIDFPGELSELPLRLGYYSWEQPLRESDGQSGQDEITSIRYLVLDTRNNFYEDGTMDWIQLGWIYNELVEALSKKEGVIIFSHDPIDPIDRLPTPLYDPHEEYRVLMNMLKAFPHVIAVAYGHKHKNENRPPKRQPGFASFQTGSLADFPQVGREVRMYYKLCADIQENDNYYSRQHCDLHENKAGYQFRIESRFVRPRGKIREPGGFLIESLLRASRRDSEKEEKTTFWRSISPFVTKHTPLSAHEWPPRNEDHPIIDEHDDPLPMFPVISFDCITNYRPEYFFKDTFRERNLLEKLNNTRKALGLKGIKQMPKEKEEHSEVICPKSSFQEI